METLKEIDLKLVDVIWALLDYPEHSSICEALTAIELRLDKIVNGDVGMSEVEARFKA